MDSAWLMAAAGLAAASAGLAGLWAWRVVLAPVLAEAQRDARGRRLALLGRVAVHRLGRRLGPLTPVRLRTALARRLIRAGEPGHLGPEAFLALQAMGAGVGGAAGLAGVWAAGPGSLAALPVLLAAVGALLPAAWLEGRVRRRTRALSRALPSRLDLLTLAVEAGLDFAAALALVVEQAPSGTLETELAAVLHRIRMGRTREEALRELAERTGHPAVARLVTALVRAGRMGTPMGRILRLEAARLRVERTQRAEKLAAEAPVKLLLPLVLFIFPTVFLVIFGPIVFHFLHGGAAW